MGLTSSSNEINECVLDTPAKKKLAFLYRNLRRQIGNIQFDKPLFFSVPIDKRRKIKKIPDYWQLYKRGKLPHVEKGIKSEKELYSKYGIVGSIRKDNYILVLMWILNDWKGSLSHIIRFLLRSNKYAQKSSYVMGESSIVVDDRKRKLKVWDVDWGEVLNKSENHPFIILPGILTDEDDTWAHQTAVILYRNGDYWKFIDYDPWGHKEVSFDYHKQMLEEFKEILENDERTKHAKLVRSHGSCPVGLQVQTKKYDQGFCMTFTLLWIYITMVLVGENPNWILSNHNERIWEQFMKNCLTKENIYTLVVGFANLVISRATAFYKGSGNIIYDPSKFIDKMDKPILKLTTFNLVRRKKERKFREQIDKKKKIKLCSSHNDCQEGNICIKETVGACEQDSSKSCTRDYQCGFRSGGSGQINKCITKSVNVCRPETYEYVYPEQKYPQGVPCRYHSQCESGNCEDYQGRKICLSGTRKRDFKKQGKTGQTKKFREEERRKEREKLTFVQRRIHSEAGKKCKTDLDCFSGCCYNSKCSKIPGKCISQT